MMSKKQRNDLRDFILGICPSNQRYVERGTLACLDDLDKQDERIAGLATKLGEVETASGERIIQMGGLKRRIAALETKLKPTVVTRPEFRIEDDL